MSTIVSIPSVLDPYFLINYFPSLEYFTDGCSSLTNRNLPASFWNSNYIPPAPAPTHHQVSRIQTFWRTIFVWVVLLLINIISTLFFFFFELKGSRFIFNWWQLHDWSMGSTCSTLWYICSCCPRTCRSGTCLSS